MKSITKNKHQIITMTGATPIPPANFRGALVRFLMEHFELMIKAVKINWLLVLLLDSSAIGALIHHETVFLM